MRTMNLSAFGIEFGRGRWHEEVVYSVGLAYNLLDQAIGSYLKPYGLTTAKFNVLMVIKHQGKASGISQAEIGKRLIVTASNMTRILDKLERLGLAGRAGQKGDRRVNLVRITPRGSKLLDEIWPGYDRRLKQLANHLPAVEQQQGSKILMNMVSRLQKVREALKEGE